MVAPSFVVVRSPFFPIIALSMPRGPRVVRIISDTILATIMLLLTAISSTSRRTSSLRMMAGTFGADLDLDN